MGWSGEAAGFVWPTHGRPPTPNGRGQQDNGSAPRRQLRNHVSHQNQSGGDGRSAFGRTRLSREGFDDDHAAGYYLHPHLVPCKETHAKEWLRIGEVCFDGACLTVPENGYRIDIKEAYAPITKHCPLTAEPRQTKRCDEPGGQGQRPSKARVDDGFDGFPLSVCPMDNKLDRRFMVHVHHASDHAVSGIERGPKRCTARCPIRTNHVWASG